MIEQGLVDLIQAGFASASPPLFPTCPGGFAKQLPPNQAAPAYTYRVIADSANLTLRSFKGFGNAHFEFRAYGVDGARALLLAKAIDGILSGFRGALPDPDATLVDSIIRTDRDGPDFADSARNYFVTLEYSIWFYAN